MFSNTAKGITEKSIKVEVSSELFRMEGHEGGIISSRRHPSSCVEKRNKWENLEGKSLLLFSPRPAKSTLDHSKLS